MKKKLLSLFLTVIMLFSALPVLADSQMPTLNAVFNDENITLGTISAEVSALDATDGVAFTIGYYSGGAMVCCRSVTLNNGTQTITLDTPDIVKEGDFAKIIAYNPSTLEPYTITNGNPVIFCNQTKVATYSGMNERYYTLDSALGSLTVEKYTETNAMGKPVTRRRIIVSDNGTPFRLKDMTEGEYSFEYAETPRMRLEYTESDGLRVYYYSAGSAKQRWLLEEYNTGYAIRLSGGNYLAIKDGAVCMQDDKYEWALTFAGETPTTLMTSLDGFGLLTQKQQQRVMEICTSIGADAMPYAPNNDSFLDDCEAVFSRLYNGNYTPEEEKAQILSAVSTRVVGELAESGFYYSLPAFPGGDATITQSAPIKTTHVMWDLVEENGVIYSASEEHPYTGAPINCYLINVTYKTEDTTQTVKLYCVDPSFANVQTAINALGKFPYAYRQHIKNMYVYLSTTTSTYNCGGEELFVRLKGTATEQAMIKSFAHELGHSNDYMANGDVNNRSSHWNQGTKWQLAVEDDIATISNYGNSNSDEGFAEFARLYWLCYGNRDLEIGIKQLFPNRFASFQRMLTKIGCTGEILY
ncbi:MAG: hypothetical protein IJO83_03490 [Clostridia bacterium]|nr:hypothetical protein [Clostridia bacterium]